MPISIPPFSNVPARADPITSPWAQQLTQFAVDGPRGKIGRTVATASAFTTTSTTAVDLTVTAGQPPSLTLALDTTRLYRVTFACPVTLNSTTERAVFELYVGGVSYRTQTMAAGGTAAQGLSALVIMHLVPTSSASTVYKMMARTTNAAAALSAPFVAAANPMEFVIEDIGKV